MGQSYTIDQLPALPSPLQSGDLMIVTRGQNEYRVSGSSVMNPSGYLSVSETGAFVTTGQTGHFVDKSSAQTILGSKTFGDSATFSAIVIASGAGINVNSGVVIMPFTYKTGDYYVSNSDFTIKCSGTFSVNLSGTSPLAGRMINVKNSHSGVISLIPRPMFLDNSTGAQTLLSGTCLTIQADGVNWIII